MSHRLLFQDLEKILKKGFYERFPEGNFKNRIVCIYYKSLYKLNKINFCVNYNNNIFKVQINGIVLKFQDYLDIGFVNLINGYLKNYNLKESDIVIDAGSYTGVFTAYASKMIGEKGLVISYEPDPKNYAKLKKNIALNELNNIIAIKKGIWSKNTTLEFNASSRQSSSFFFEEISEKKIINVSVVRLDDELENLNIKNANFIKMDIEGAEIEALKGCQKILERHIVNFAIASYHIVNGKKTCSQLEKIFSDLGYQSVTDFPKHLTTYGFFQK